MPEGWDFGVLGVKCLFFKKHGHVAYRIEGDDEKKRIQTKCVSLWWGQKVKYYFISSKALGFAMVRHRPCILVSF